MNCAMILAGGVGSRLGADRPKQFVEILGKPVIVYTIEAFQNHNEIDEIEIVCIKPYIDYMWNLIEKYKLTKVKYIVEGGKNYQYSVINGMDNLSNKIELNDIVVIHWGASSFVSEDIISDSIKVCREKGNAVSASSFYPLAGTKDSDNESKEWIDRDKIACIASPHSFKYSYLKKIYEDAERENLIESTEPHTTSLMYRMKETVYLSKGSQANIKITTKEDLELFEGYLLFKKNKKHESSN